jgi:hypothetical protein
LRHAIPSASRTTRAEKKPEDAHIPARAQPLVQALGLCVIYV